MCALNLSVPDQKSVFKPRILVLGVGGAGGNAVNNMIQADLQGVEFAVANTDAQAMELSLSDRRVRLGTLATQGLGAGANPIVGRAAAEESLQEVLDEIGEVNMVFITAGMGGGTGTGAAPLIAKALKERGILTVGVATKPFSFEGIVRQRQAEEGIELLAEAVDTLIVIPNENLFRVANERTSYADALKMADEVLYDGVRAISDLIVRPGNINLDFADVRALMTVMGKSMMGTGEAEGENRAIDAAELAISNPLLDDINLSSAKGLLLNISGGPDLTMYEVDEAAKRITREVMPDSNIITGTSIDPHLEGRVRVSVVATGIDEEAAIKAGSPAGAFAKQEPQMGAASAMKPMAPIAPKAAAPVALAQIKTTVPASPTAARSTFNVTGSGGVVHTIQGQPGTMEFARSVANPPKPSTGTPSVAGIQGDPSAAVAMPAAKPRNPIAPLPESLLTPPARNDLMDLRDVRTSQSAANASAAREETAPVRMPNFDEPAPAPAPVQPRESNLLRAQLEAAQRHPSAMEAAPAAQPADPAAYYEPELAAEEAPAHEQAPETLYAPMPEPVAAPAPVEPLTAYEPEPRIRFEAPLTSAAPAPAVPAAPAAPAVHDEAEATEYGYGYDEAPEPNRGNGPLSRLFDMARGGFNQRPSPDEVHEYQESNTSGFDRLATSSSVEPAPAQPQPQPRGTVQRPPLTSLSTTSMGDDGLDIDESEMNIPAFLRRQMN